MKTRIREETYQYQRVLIHAKSRYRTVLCVFIWRRATQFRGLFLEKKNLIRPLFGFAR